MGQMVQLRADDGVEIAAWVVHPKVKARAGIVIAQEIFGVNDHIQSVAQRWADLGFLAIAPALFARLEPDVQLGYDEDGMTKGKLLKARAENLPEDGVLKDIRAAAQWLKDQGQTHVGVVGFCWGGLMAWRSAALVAQVDAAVCYYGGGMTVPPEIERQPRVPVMAHFGKRDAHISLESVQAFSQAHPEVQVHLYEADHGFNCDQRGSYERYSAAQAQERTLAFWMQHLGG